MGDRTWVSYELRGEIRDFVAFNSLCKAVASERIADENGSVFKEPAAVAHYIAAGNTTFTCSDGNYGKVEEFECVLQILDVPFITKHGNGDNYDSGGGFWSRDEEDSYVGDGPSIDPDYLGLLLYEEDALAKIQAAVERAKRGSGDHLPPFSIPETVLAKARENGLIPTPKPDGAVTHTVKMSETVYYEFKIDLQPGADPIEAAKAHFVTGPDPSWFTHCEDRKVLEVTPA
ncbi:MAG: hypothetical protein JJ902_05350 [Roseibium sp.]|nr:hypothetical protein [Roseibium sp.]